LKDEGKGELNITINEHNTFKSGINKSKKDLKEMTIENSMLREENNKLKLELDNYKQSISNYIASFDSSKFAFLNQKILSRIKSKLETRSNQAFSDYWGNEKNRI